MDILLTGAAILLDPSMLLVILAGTVGGVLVGVLPGLSSTMATALLLPFTVTMEPIPAISLLAALYCAGTYGGSITAILINAPGAPDAYNAVFDYPLETALPGIRQPLTVLAPRDDVWTQTERARPYLPSQAAYVDLPHLGLDLFYYATDEMATLIDQYLPA